MQRPHIVVVPLSTFPNWEREFALWAPQLNVVPFIGNQAGRNMVKQHELYADASLVKGKAKSHSKHAELQVAACFLLSQCIHEQPMDCHPAQDQQHNRLSPHMLEGHGAACT